MISNRNCTLRMLWLFCLCGFQAAQAQKLEGAAKAAEEAAEEALERAKKAKQIEVRPDSGT